MKQILQNLRTGETTVAEVPAPAPRRGALLIRTTRTLISAGTERMLVEFSKASLLAKARAQPDKVKQVLDKIRTDGLLATLEAVFRRLDQPLPLGYCAAGVVTEVGPGVTGWRVGDRVASNAPHAELASVPVHLCARIPDEVTDDQAAFTVLASIALQGIRLAGPTLGERFVVYGLGLIGQVAVQLLRAHGCEVLGVDLSPDRLRLAESFGARTVQADTADVIAAVEGFTAGRGADGVLITASAKTDDIVHHAAQACRKRGRIVLVGVVGLNLRRADFYEKELTFQVSCSYGPGRYDDAYEQGGQDYPPGFVRWTEQRNFQAILDCLATGRLQVDSLISGRFRLDQAEGAYADLAGGAGSLGVLLEYPDAPDTTRQIPSPAARRSAKPAGEKVTVGVIGAGNFSTNTLMPALAKTPAAIAYVADLDGAAASHLAGKYGAGQAVTDHKLILADPAVDAVLVAVQHNLHASMVRQALAAGKHVFVEKPLAMTEGELSDVLDAAEAAPDRIVCVGFNRRFSPHTEKLRALLAGRTEPLCMTMTVNAGAIPADHWVHDPVRGGGRVIGEACHFIDLLSHLAGRWPRTVSAAFVGPGPAVQEDKTAIVLTFEDGSVGTVNYFANGSREYPKETLEIFSEGRVLRLENFRRLRGYGMRGFRSFKTSRQDKGHRAQFAALVRGLAEGIWPIPLDDLVATTRATLAARESAQTQQTIAL